MKMKECIVCGSAFMPANNRQITCSQPCATVNQAINRIKLKESRKRPEKHCSRCGQLFATETNSRTICDKCKTKTPVTRPCIECGNEFTTKGNSGKLICSDACKQARKKRYKAKVYAATPKEKQLITGTCIICTKEFTGTDPRIRFCSAECRHTMKLENQRLWRLSLVKIEKPLTTCTCKVCNVTFEHTRKITICGDECRARQKRDKAATYNSTRVSQRTYCEKPVKQVAEKSQKKRVLTPQKPKADAVAVDAMIELNRNAPINDREVLKKKNIASPDLSNIEFRHHDKKMRITRFFTTAEKYNNYLKTISL